MRQRSCLSHATVVAYLALFIALGGTAIATVIITSNSQVARGTISGHKPPSGDHANIIAGSVNGNDVADNSLGGADIAESSLGKVPNADTIDGINSQWLARGEGSIAEDHQSIQVGHGANLYAFDRPNLPATPRAQFFYTCPANSSDFGSVVYANVNPRAADVFLDNGGADPSFAHVPNGGTYGSATNPSGELITFHIHYTDGSGDVTAWVFSVHQHNNINPSNSTCDVYMQALYGGPVNDSG